MILTGEDEALFALATKRHNVKVLQTPTTQRHNDTTVYDTSSCLYHYVPAMSLGCVVHTGDINR